MSLARKLALRIAALLLGLGMLAGASVWGLVALNDHFRVAEDEYTQLRAVYTVGHHAATVRQMINADSADRDTIVNELNAALEQLRSLHGPRYARRVAAMDAALTAVALQARQQRDLHAHLPSINAALGQVAELASEIRQAITDNRAAVSDRLHTTIVSVIVVALIIVLASTWIGVAQYRSVIVPLRRLEHAVRRAAQADFSAPLPAAGDHEFAQLAEQFNRMAVQLDDLYRDLESQVAARSRQLVQSERLASVGYLAAGFAHEINNPLGIICGYAESTLKRLEKPEKHGENAESRGRTAKALRIICEEAFRCRDITTKLLTLARPSSGQRQSIALQPVAQRVVDMLGGLPQFKSRRVAVRADDDLNVMANEAELIQVLINLTANALEAVDDETGHVDLHLYRDDPWAMIDVIDNGRGMNDDTLGRVFEPFFTDKPQRDLRGTGLGLSVAHAIVEQHGGQLTAASDGPDRGSTFTLRLPIAVRTGAMTHA